MSCPPGTGYLLDTLRHNYLERHCRSIPRHNRCRECRGRFLHNDHSDKPDSLDNRPYAHKTSPKRIDSLYTRTHFHIENPCDSLRYSDSSLDRRWYLVHDILDPNDTLQMVHILRLDIRTHRDNFGHYGILRRKSPHYKS